LRAPSRAAICAAPVARRFLRHARRPDKWYGFEETENIELGVDCAAAPDIAIGDATAKGRVVPLRVVVGFDRDDVQMSHEQYRFEIGVPAWPTIEQAVATDVSLPRVA
jgi:hypothetical protein